MTNSKFGFIGIGFGAVALLLALLHFWAGPFSPRPSLEQTVAEKAASIKNITIAALRGKKASIPEPRGSMDADKITNIVTALLGGIAIIFGVIGFANKEPIRVSSGAAILGGGAIAFQFAVLAIGIIIVVILVMYVLSQIGFS